MRLPTKEIGKDRDTELSFCISESTDLPMSFEDRVVAVGIATQFQERSKEVFKMGHRAELYAARVAKCLAAVEGREKVTVDDLKKAIKYLSHKSLL
uniref:magnesium chelatase n=1 Tax=Kalanchoe fedtschenkoi TaxID=63787 RepID=A0A7N1A7F1_KALFE